jgi:transcriptional regulator with XRE-family HTH domain
MQNIQNAYNKKHMAVRSSQITGNLEKILQDLGQQLRNRRKELGISAIATAEAAGMSRITLYRIERGEASVAMGAYLNVISALGLKFELEDQQTQRRKRDLLGQEIPNNIRIADYKQLKQLAWQLKDTKEISPKEALDLYERNWRHVDLKAMDSREKKLLDTLLSAFGRERLLV